MYLARQRIDGITHFVIRESFCASDHYECRDLFDLGADPSKYIHYPGGNGYYYDYSLEEALSRKGLQVDSRDLDRLFFEFLDPEIQRVITGFDRSFRCSACKSDIAAQNQPHFIHIFDKRRYHYLRFGNSRQRRIATIPEKVFHPLQCKSRDELEHYFESEERKLKFYEHLPYVSTIFQLTAFQPDPRTDQSILLQLDAFFLKRLCRLNTDAAFMAGVPASDTLYEHLIKYAVIYYDTPANQNDVRGQYIRDFINRHRVYRPPAKVKVRIREAEKLFGYGWKALERMNRSDFTRVFRKAALKHHPDQGGDTETFRRLVQYFNALLHKKPRGK